MYASTAEWTPGAQNISGQKYTWTINGQAAASGELGAAESERSSVQDQLVINPGDAVVFGVISFNQWKESEPATMSGTAPTPDPDPPTAGSLTFTELPVARRV